MSYRCPRCKYEPIQDCIDYSIYHVEDRRYDYDEKEAALITMTEYKIQECASCHQLIIVTEDHHTLLRAEVMSDG
jgi:hypothetical protein